MSDEEQNYYKSEGAYYALPHHEHQAGLIYDIDLFEQEELYFAENGAPSESGYTGMAAYTGTGNKSAGPDGKYETADDGLPATYDEFYMLCNYMISKQSDVDITPILWSGTNRNDYIDWFLSELTADFEGEKQLKLNYTFDGIAKNLIAIDKNGAVSELEDTKISSSNGYLVYQSEGRYRALEFFDKVVDTKAWYNESANFGSLSHTEAQYNYLLGATGLSDTRYAFLIDGCWWGRTKRPIRLTASSTEKAKNSVKLPDGLRLCLCRKRWKNRSEIRLRLLRRTSPWDLSRAIFRRLKSIWPKRF